jgi:hypothetical protein
MREFSPVIYGQQINPDGGCKALVPPAPISSPIRFGIVRLDDAVRRKSRHWRHGAMMQV